MPYCGQSVRWSSSHSHLLKVLLTGVCVVLSVSHSAAQSISCLVDESVSGLLVSVLAGQRDGRIVSQSGH